MTPFLKPIPETKTEKTLAGATPALHRAAQRARIIARRTGTPLVLGKDGRIEKRRLEGEAAATLREDFEKYTAAGPDAPPPEKDRLG